MKSIYRKITMWLEYSTFTIKRRTLIENWIRVVNRPHWINLHKFSNLARWGEIIFKFLISYRWFYSDDSKSVIWFHQIIQSMRHRTEKEKFRGKEGGCLSWWFIWLSQTDSNKDAAEAYIVNSIFAFKNLYRIFNIYHYLKHLLIYVQLYNLLIIRTQQSGEKC